MFITKIFNFISKVLHGNQYPLVSILMPAYNSEAYIKEAIESILNQTYNNFEFIIINDGSTDNTEHIIKSYQDDRIKYFYNETNKGLIYTLNKGLDIAKGKYIARMDSDDISYPERIEKQVKFLDSHIDIGILGTWYKAFGDESYIDKKIEYPKLSDMQINPIAHPTVMIRKKVLDKYSLKYDYRYKHAEDYELWIRASKYTKLANLQEILLDYRWSKQNISSIYAKEQNQCAEVIKQRVRNSLIKDKTLLKIFLDDTQLLKELSALGKFAYMPNSGNMGDMLIASATMKWLDINQLDWYRLKENEVPEILVYGGGGAWIEEWINDLEPLMNLMKKCKKVVILPSSFNNVQHFVDILDEKFIIFCRENKSYEYLKNKNTKAKILLDHDMALRLTEYKHILPPTKELQNKSKDLYKKISKIKNKHVKLFRTDSESMGHYTTDIDISDMLGWFSPYESRENIDFAAATMLDIVSKFKHIKTDRLHVGIASALSVVDVSLYDNTYGKIKNVYMHSLINLPHVTYEGDK